MKKVILFLILAFLVSISTPLNSDASDYLGEICFQLDNFPVERFFWKVEKVDDLYQISGSCPHFGGNMNGGGALDFLTVFLVMTEADPDGWQRTFSIDISLIDLTGTATFKWFDENGNPGGVYIDEPVSHVPCSAPLDSEGPDSRMKTQIAQSCPDGEFMTGLDNEGNIICRGPEPVADIVAYGVGLESHSARAALRITPVNLPQTVYLMGCLRSDNDAGPIGTDPFDSEHANFMLEFGPQLTGATLDGIGVEIFEPGNTNASVQLKSVDNGAVLAVSDEVSTASPGWIEFSFPNFVINESQILVNFVTQNDAQIYNCAYKVEFIPQ